MNLIGNWFRERFSDPQVMLMSLLLLFGMAVVYFLGSMLVPVFAALVIAYLLEGMVRFLRRRGLPRMAAVPIVFVGFVAAVIVAFVVLIPLLTDQVAQLVNQLPSMLTIGQNELLKLPQRFPGIVSEEQVREVVTIIRLELIRLGQRAVTFSLAQLKGVITYLIYLVLVPLLVFFFLKDKNYILGWFRNFLPEHRTLAAGVWDEVDVQTGNYIRGKVWEILIIWAVTYATFLRPLRTGSAMPYSTWNS